MEAFLQEIERADEFNVNSAGAPKFRAGVMSAISLYQEEHGTTDLPYDVHEGLTPSPGDPPKPPSEPS